MWRKLRIAVLLFVLATVAQRAWLSERDLQWDNNFYVALHPVNADGSAAVAAYMTTLTPEQFEPLTGYFAAEAERYGVKLYHPFEIQLGAPVDGDPPLPPGSGSTLDSLRWSLQFRWWAWRHSPDMRVAPKIRLYLRYHDPAMTHALAHSTALSKGRIGLVNVYGSADAAEQNLIVIAHELLHTVGASDKYDPATNRPLFPAGYAAPEQEPRYPQTQAELMAGRVPLSATEAAIPAGLEQTVIGPVTAREIRWLNNH